MATQLYSPAMLSPVSLDDVKVACRLVAPGVTPSSYVAEDSFLALLLSSAIGSCEQFLRRALLAQTWDLFLDAFPLGSFAGVPELAGELVAVGARCGEIRLPYPVLQSVSFVKYYDAAGVQQTLDSSLYQVDAASFPGRLRPVRGASWPATEPLRFNAVQVRYLAGYASASLVPGPIKLGILNMCAHLYSNRESVVVGQGVNVVEIPDTARKLWWPYRCISVM